MIINDRWDPLAGQWAEWERSASISTPKLRKNLYEHLRTKISFVSVSWFLGIAAGYEIVSSWIGGQNHLGPNPDLIWRCWCVCCLSRFLACILHRNSCQIPDSPKYWQGSAGVDGWWLWCIHLRHFFDQLIGPNSHEFTKWCLGPTSGDLV